MSERIWTDGGPQFHTKFKRFCSDLGIEHELTSPYNPKSNGHAETAVKNLKMVQKCETLKENFTNDHFHFRSFPRSGSNISPAEKFFNHRLKTSLPQQSSPKEAKTETLKFWVGQEVWVQNNHTKLLTG